MIKTGKQPQSRIQWQFLQIILPVAIVPLIIIVIFITRYYFSTMNREYQNLYTIVLDQVKNNIDFVYEQYSVVLSNILNNQEIQRELNRPPYSSRQEENLISRNIIGDESLKWRLREATEEKIDGHLFLIELDRKSLVDGTDYKIHYGTSGNYITQKSDITNIISDPLFTEMNLNLDRKLVFGMIRQHPENSSVISNRPILLFPYLQQGINRISKFILVVLNTDFIPKFYRKIDQLKRGTLYILDKNMNIISYNHPASDDYYDYDPATSQYHLGTSNRDPENEIMNYNHYRQLNTDPRILKNSDVTIMLRGDRALNHKRFHSVNIASRNYSTIVTHNGIKYLSIVLSSDSSEVTLAYFYPLSEIRRPIFQSIQIILLITLSAAVFVILISYLLSRSITTPLNQLVIASNEISQGHYDVELNIHTKNEFSLLSESFTIMSREIMHQTQQLKEANLRLKNIDKIKTLFFNSASHQLRTPLNHIMGFTQLLLTRSFSPDYQIQLFINDFIRKLEEFRDQIPVKDYETIHKKLIGFNQLTGQGQHFHGEWCFDWLKDRSGLNPQLAQEIEVLMNHLVSAYQETDEKSMNALTIIENGVNQLVRLIDHFSEISEMDESTAEVKHNHISLTGFFNDLFLEISILLKQNKKEQKILLLKELTIPDPSWVEIDEFKLKTIMMELISNAVRYTQEGQIKLSLTKDEENYYFSVSDTGIGIRPEEFDIIFEEFGRTIDSMKVDPNGVGLGLPLAEKLAELLNGKIIFQSELHKGSVFTFVFPAREELTE